MDAWIDIRRKARACHQRALVNAKGDRRAAAIVAAALDNDDLQVRRMAFAPGILGSLDRSSRLINVAENQEPRNELVTIAHEIGHFHLHLDPHSEVTVQPSSLGGDPVDSGAGRVQGYSPRERKEVQADIFAGEFLCPSDWLRDEYVVHGKRPEAIAAEIGLPYSLVLNQMIRALLLPPLRPAQAAVRRFLCEACRRTVSLLPEFALPYLRSSVTMIALWLLARLLPASLPPAPPPPMPYQRGQFWLRRWRAQAEALCVALAARTTPIAAADFSQRALAMLQSIGWTTAHRFLFADLRAHLLGWPPSLAPDGRCRVVLK